MQEERVENLAQEISRFVNGASINELETLAKQMTKDHPTLQQSKMKLFCLFIEEMASKEYTDARNDTSKKTAIMMIDGFKQATREQYIKEDGFITKSLDKYITESAVPSGSLPTI